MHSYFNIRNSNSEKLYLPTAAISDCAVVQLPLCSSCNCITWSRNIFHIHRGEILGNYLCNVISKNAIVYLRNIIIRNDINYVIVKKIILILKEKIESNRNIKSLKKNRDQYFFATLIRNLFIAKLIQKSRFAH